MKVKEYVYCNHTMMLATLEDAMCTSCSNTSAVNRCRGHGKIHMRTCLEPAYSNIDSGGNLHCTDVKTFAGHIRKQCNRITKLKEYLKSFNGRCQKSLNPYKHDDMELIHFLFHPNEILSPYH